MPGGKKAESEEAVAKKKYSRRDFLVAGGTVAAVDALIATTPAKAALPAASPAPAEVSYPESKGYLVYDSKKCAGCTTCMLACSLTHHGVQSLSLSRIQIMQDSFGKFPNDCRWHPAASVSCRYAYKLPDRRRICRHQERNVRRIDSASASAARPDPDARSSRTDCLEPHRQQTIKCDLCLASVLE